ncbi:hypothetical protein COCMIDRAFT_2450 [Bipolaris oryzae ATCC 44560]|uniref:Uncharacterized protein n=1 Tax=Bipolaris oryzae ATCC 44560 TaxID=930090 RepID=W6ZYP0_COCMI|nr:uncharacterized protein COCMIDRAFT_2450 [Bipolaris oryzae ATCC 44560]EUC48796.1 hypothetical protein COCMIDRAFT_2450 [Bipolaris oryzae ATCC 44560]
MPPADPNISQSDRLCPSLNALSYVSGVCIALMRLAEVLATGVSPYNGLNFPIIGSHTSVHIAAEINGPVEGWVMKT